MDRFIKAFSYALHCKITKFIKSRGNDKITTFIMSLQTDDAVLMMA